MGGLLLIKANFVPGLSQLDSQEQILAYAFIFGGASSCWSARSTGTPSNPWLRRAARPPAPLAPSGSTAPCRLRVSRSWLESLSRGGLGPVPQLLLGCRHRAPWQVGQVQE